jgi:anhydro-N-acetylmuramic acid kinase
LAKAHDTPVIVLGLMSGTSQDGLDLALCSFHPKGKGYGFKLLKAETVPYTHSLKKRLGQLQTLSAEAYFTQTTSYSSFIADTVNRFLKSTPHQPTAIASHGHTVFHQPRAGFTIQAGSGAIIAAKTGITTVCDFRSLDVALNGQGAPLVPVGDEFLFGDYDACLNIGGIANISFRKKKQRMAYDICEANLLLNHLAGKRGLAYDKGGKLAASGQVNAALLQKLNAFSYYSQPGSKSLGREWFEKNILPLVEKSKVSLQDLLATSTAHIAHIIAKDLDKNKLNNVLVTGGGAFNTHLMECIKSKTTCKIIIPAAEIVNFKEAIIFAFLGYLRLSGKINTLASVTGASANSIGGAVYLGL